MRRRAFIAVGVGIAVLWLTQWGKSRGVELFVPLPTKSFLLLRLLDIAVDALFAVVALLPGFCAGWIAGRRGILLGMLTGLIGSVTFSIFFMFIGLYSLNSIQKFTPGSTLFWFWDAGFGLMITCAAGGAAGELLRSNNRRRGP
jgi:hypothetical protein